MEAIPKSDYDFARNGREIKNGSITIKTSNTRIKDEDLKKVIEISVKSDVRIQQELRRNALHLNKLKTI